MHDSGTTAAGKKGDEEKAVGPRVLTLKILNDWSKSLIAANSYKALRGSQWKTLTLATALLYPGIIFCVFFILNLLIWGRGSSGAVPFGTIVALVCMWFLVSVRAARATRLAPACSPPNPALRCAPSAFVLFSSPPGAPTRSTKLLPPTAPPGSDVASPMGAIRDRRRCPWCSLGLSSVSNSS